MEWKQRNGKEWRTEKGKGYVEIEREWMKEKEDRGIRKVKRKGRK